MKKFLLLVLALNSILVSCQKKFNGKDEQTIRVSREEVEKELDSTQKSNLGSAFNVLAWEAYRIEQEGSNKYKGTTSKDVSFEMVDGLTYQGVLDLAENILMESNQRGIEEAQKAIDSLSLKKEEFAAIQKEYDLFKIVSTKIVETEHYFTHKMVPQLEIEFQYTGEEKLTGKKWIDYDFKAESLKETSSSSSADGSFSSSFSSSSFSTRGVSDYDNVDLENKDIVKGEILLDDVMEGNYPKKYPVESSDFPDYGLEITVSIGKFFANEKVIERPEVTAKEIDAEIKENQKELEELKSEKAPFFKLETKDQ